MKNNKFVWSFALAVALSLSTINTSVMAESASEAENDTIELSQEYAYYDSELDANVISFTRGEDGSINYLTQAEVEELTNVEEIDEDTVLNIDESELQEDTVIDEVAPCDNYRQWYKYVPESSKKTVKGKRKKVTAELEAPKGGGSISITISYTVKQTFSANVTTTSQKEAIQAGCGFTWVKSASTSTTYKVKLTAGQKGYLSFTPYYYKTVGKLKSYSNWDGLISSTSATGYSVKKTSYGEPDGIYKFIET